MGFCVILMILSLTIGGCLYLVLYPGIKQSDIRWGRRIIGANILMTVLLIFCYFGPWKGEAAIGWLIEGITLWYIIQLFMVALLFVIRMGQLVWRKIMGVPVDASRRRICLETGAAFGLSLTGGLYGTIVGKDDLVIRDYDVPVADLGDRLAGYRLAQLSDIHLGPFFDLPKLAELVERAAAAKPDMLVITGDLFDDNATTVAAAKLLDGYCEAFPEGIYYCLGNHEYIRSLALVEEALAGTRIKFLKNANQLAVQDTKPLYLAGTAYPMDRANFDSLMQQYTQEAMEGIPEGAVTVLLAHHPEFIDSGAAAGADLVLTGHTHGGQLGFLGIPLVPPVMKYMRGLYKMGKTLGYVHCGNGSWFPFRLGCPPEIAIFKLVKSTDAK